MDKDAFASLILDRCELESPPPDYQYIAVIREFFSVVDDTRTSIEYLFPELIRRRYHTQLPRYLLCHVPSHRYSTR